MVIRARLILKYRFLGEQGVRVNRTFLLIKNRTFFTYWWFFEKSRKKKPKRMLDFVWFVRFTIISVRTYFCRQFFINDDFSPHCQPISSFCRIVDWNPKLEFQDWKPSILEIVHFIVWNVQSLNQSWTSLTPTEPGS